MKRGISWNLASPFVVFLPLFSFAFQNGCFPFVRTPALRSPQADPERQKRAMADPEIQAILGDPQMRSILQEMQTDPKKANAAMQDPDISAKLQKLIAAGVLQVR